MSFAVDMKDSTHRSGLNRTCSTRLHKAQMSPASLNEDTDCLNEVREEHANDEYAEFRKGSVWLESWTGGLTYPSCILKNSFSSLYFAACLKRKHIINW